MINLREIQIDNYNWARVNFADTWMGGDPTDPILGVCEEAGELAHAHLKKRQRIRGTPKEHDLAMKDAVGDIVIYLMDVCNRMNWDLEKIIEGTWNNVVKKRDWNDYREKNSSV